MHVSLVLTAIGNDRPGLVRALSAAVAEHGGSWQESSMARLAGKFAGILRAEVPAARAADLETALRGLASAGLQVVVERSAPGPAPDRRPLRIELVGADRPGLVRELSRALAERGVNIDELESESGPAPMSGGQLFTCRLRVGLPAGVAVEDLRAALEALAHEIVVDIAVDEPDAP